MTLEKSLEQIRRELSADLQQVGDTSELQALHVKYLGKKGKLQALMPLLKEAPPEQRPELGQAINTLKQEVTSALDQTAERLSSAELDARLEKETLDITLPGRRRHLGRKHLLTQMLDRGIDILSGMGFTVQYGPDIETDYYNFEALNFSKDHPARDMQDTFYLAPDVLLRTHTSNTQVRVMEATKPPIRLIAPGKCYRNEDITARSHVLFHQIEGLYIDRDVSFADLFSTLQEFLSKFFETDVEIRFRPSYFPFVEPGMEVDIACLRCSGKGCHLCKQTGWLEICGAGMIHPEVMRSGGIDPEEYSGYAWGMGIERLALLIYHIPDIRLFLQNDLRFLAQFP